MSFTETLTAAKLSDRTAKDELLKMYNPFIIKNSMVNNRFDEDLYQSLVQVFLKCINNFII